MRMTLTKTPEGSGDSWQGLAKGQDFVGCSAAIERRHFTEKGPSSRSVYEFAEWEYDNNQTIKERY